MAFVKRFRGCRIGEAVVLTVLAVSGAVATADAGEVERGLSRPSGADGFGRAVDVSGDTVVVGAPARGEQVGRAFVFGRVGSSFSKLAELVPSNSTPGDGFGRSVAILGTTIVVGSASVIGIPGSVHVFEEPPGGWSGLVGPAATLLPSDARTSFGGAVDISRNPAPTASRAPRFLWTAFCEKENELCPRENSTRLRPRREPGGRPQRPQPRGRSSARGGGPRDEKSPWSSRSSRGNHSRASVVAMA